VHEFEVGLCSWVKCNWSLEVILIEMDKQTNQSRSRNFLQLSVWVIALLISVSLLSSDNFAASSSSIVVAILLLLILIFGGLWTWSIFRHKGSELATPLDLAMLAIITAVLFSAIFSLDPSRSFRSVLNWFALVFVYYLAVNAFRSGWRIPIFERALLLVLTLIMLTAYLQFFIWLQNSFFANSDNALAPTKLLRVSGTISNPNSFAVFLNIGIMIALGVKISLQQRRWPLSIVFWLIFAAPMVVLHGSRNGWLSAIFGLVSLLTTWYLWRAAGKRIGLNAWLRIGVLILGTSIIALALVTLLRPVTFNFEELSGYATRTTFWRIAIITWRENLLTGQGLGTFPTAFLESVSVPFEPFFASAHSLFFNMTTEMGFLGMAAYLLLIGQLLYLLRSALKQNRLSSNSPGLLGALGVIFAFSLIDYLWLQVQLVAFILIAALVADIDPKPAIANGGSIENKVLRIAMPLIWSLILIFGFFEYRSSNNYEAGVEAAINNNWTEAADIFESGEAALPYSESSFLLAKGFANGVLAKNEINYLPAAVETYDRLIQLEPSWSLNYANLAGLQWQKGNSQTAIELMRRAVELAPDVQLYRLNLGLWYEETGQLEKATAAYKSLLATDNHAGSTPFWLATTTRANAWPKANSVQNSSSEDLEPVYAALDRLDPKLALDHLSQVLEQEPDNNAALLAQGVAYLYDGNSQSAEDAWKRAESGGASYRRYSHLWQSLLTDNPEQGALDILEDMTRPSIFAPRNQNLSSYSRDVFVRPGLAAEILPQLQCFSIHPDLERQLKWLRNWAEQEAYLELSQHLDALIDTDDDGLRSCMVQTEIKTDEAKVNLIYLR
jgi:O-antigen ligase